MILLGLVLASNVFAASIDAIQVLKISGQDGRAVIKDLTGKTVVVKKGDSVGPTGRVIEIAAGRVVIEENKGATADVVIFRLVNGKQHVERIRKTMDKPNVVAPGNVKPSEQNGSRIH
jgi:hypothetical protein